MLKELKKYNIETNHRNYDNKMTPILVKEGDLVEILYMKDEPHYKGAIGYIKYEDDMGQIHGSWGIALRPDTDVFRVYPLRYLVFQEAITKDKLNEPYFAKSKRDCLYARSFSKYEEAKKDFELYRKKNFAPLPEDKILKTSIIKLYVLDSVQNGFAIFNKEENRIITSLEENLPCDVLESYVYDQNEKEKDYKLVNLKEEYNLPIDVIMPNIMKEFFFRHELSKIELKDNDCIFTIYNTLEDGIKIPIQLSLNNKLLKPETSEFVSFLACNLLESYGNIYYSIAEKTDRSIPEDNKIISSYEETLKAVEQIFRIVQEGYFFERKLNNYDFATFSFSKEEDEELEM